jgi:DNA polymerase III gamma/tau subunit
MKQAADFSESELVRFFHSLSETEAGLRTAAHPRYQLEVGLVKLMEMRRLAPLEQVFERLAALEESLRTGKAPALRGATPPASQGGPVPGGRPAASGGSTTPRVGGAMKAEGAQDAPPQASYEEPPFGGVGGTAQSSAAPVLTLVPPPGPPTADPSSSPFGKGAPGQAGQAAQPARKAHAHDSVVESIKAALEERRRMFIVTALDGARKVAVEAEELYAEFAPESKHLRDTLAKPENVKLLRDVCRDVLGREVGVRVVVKEAGDTSEEGPLSKQDEEQREKQRLREMAEQHPAVKQLLKTFHAEIVDVRRVDTEGP